MKKSMLALAVLATFAGAASAQSSVTMYGRLDLGVGKPVANSQKGMFEASGSRLGMRGVEDIGGGLKGFFQIEHRFSPDNGVNTNATGGATRMWQGISIVGLEGGFGKVTLGRNYNTSFLQAQVSADPFGWDTVTARQHAAITRGGSIGTVRSDSSLTYQMMAGGFALGAQISEATDAFDSTPKKPWNVALSYGAGPISFGLGHEYNGAATGGKWTSAHFGWRFGTVTPRLFLGSGTATNSTAKVKGTLLSVTAGVGAGEFRAAVGKLDTAGTTANPADISSIGLGYHHSLSKRTTLYVDLARDSKAASDKMGYDLGIKHNF